MQLAIACNTCWGKNVFRPKPTFGQKFVRFSALIREFRISICKCIFRPQWITCLQLKDQHHELLGPGFR